MTTFRPKLWTSLSAAVLLTSGALAGCGAEGEGGEAATTTPGAAAVGGEGEGEGAGGAAATPSTAVGGEGEGEGAAVTGEAGAQDAYASVPADSRTALRLAHLKGFFLAAQAVAPTGGAEAASALIGQGMLEVFDPAAADYRANGLVETPLRKAAQTGAPADVSAALAALDAAAAKAGGDPKAVVKGMTDIASGLYAGVVADGAVDTIEYQHAYGAALSARAAATGTPALKADLDRFVALWPTPTAPEDPTKVTPVGEVLAQASRIELAL